MVQLFKSMSNYYCDTPPPHRFFLGKNVKFLDLPYYACFTKIVQKVDFIS